MEAVYLLYCDEMISSKISPSISQIEGTFGVKITYMPGQFSISRNEATVYQHQQAKHTLIKLINRGTSLNQWFWGSQNGFVPYDAASNHFIEEAYNSKVSEIALNINNQIYRVDFTQMTQRSISGMVPRPICRVPPVEMPKRTSEVWSYTCDKWKRPKIFPGVVIRLLKSALEKEQNRLEVTLNKERYVVNLSNMKMTDNENREYAVIRKSN